MLHEVLGVLHSRLLETDYRQLILHDVDFGLTTEDLSDGHQLRGSDLRELGDRDDRVRLGKAGHSLGDRDFLGSRLAMDLHLLAHFESIPLLAGLPIDVFTVSVRRFFSPFGSFLWTV